MHDFIEFHAEDSGAQDVTYGIGTIKDKRIETGGMTFWYMEMNAFGQKNGLSFLSSVLFSITDEAEGTTMTDNDTYMLKWEVAIERGRKIVLHIL